MRTLQTILLGSLLIGCLPEYREQYQLNPDAHYRPLHKESTWEDCTDKADNDGNALVDCADPGCKIFEFCHDDSGIPAENTAARCRDQVDNDANGLIDCKDRAGCGAFEFCLPPVENTLALCRDGRDNDEDALIDCKDPDCKDLHVCTLPAQDTVFVVDYKTTGRLAPVIYGTRPPRNLTWYFNGGDAAGGDALGLKGLVPGRSEEVTSCGAEPLCRKITFSGEWGIAFTIFLKNDGTQDTVDMSGWMASSLKLSVRSRVGNLRLKLESRHLADVQEIPLSDLGFDPSKDAWQDLVVPLSKWTTQQKLSTNRLPFSIWKPAGPGGEVFVENIRWE